MEKLNEAIAFAAEVFEGQRRKGENIPAVFHSLEVGHIAETLCDDENVVIAALLHDTIEDAGVSREELASRFGDRVAELVAGESENKRPERRPEDTWRLRKQESIDHIRRSTDRGLKILFLSDKLSNMRSLSRCKSTFGDRMWTFFHQQDPKQHRWYYTAIAEAVGELADTAAYQEYIALIEKTFSEE